MPLFSAAGKSSLVFLFVGVFLSQVDFYFLSALTNMVPGSLACIFFMTILILIMTRETEENGNNVNDREAEFTGRVLNSCATYV